MASGRAGLWLAKDDAGVPPSTGDEPRETDEERSRKDVEESRSFEGALGCAPPLAR